MNLNFDIRTNHDNQEQNNKSKKFAKPRKLMNIVLDPEPITLNINDNIVEKKKKLFETF